MRPPRLLRIRTPEGVLLTGLAVWGLAPVAAMIVHALRFHERLTGADGVVGGDQLQYLAWARDAGSHLLAANLFSLPVSPHVYAQPLFTVSGVVWWLGLPLPLAYWLWKPVAIAVLFAGPAGLAARMFRGRPWPGVAALSLSLFLFTPLASLVGWAVLGPTGWRDELLKIAAELFPAGELWGYLPAALAVGLMPIVLLASERALVRDEPPSSRRRFTAIAGGAALLIAWLHPWQGVTLLLILIALAAWGESDQRRLLAVPIVAAGLALLYYLLLSKLDPAWELAARNELVPRPPLSALIAGLVPPLLLARAGLRRPGRDLMERALLLWIPASLGTYFLVGSFSSHALESISLPLAVLAVRGWLRLRWPPVLGALAVAAATLPGMVYEARAFRDVERGPIQQYYLGRSDARAVDWVAQSAPPGGVLARTIFAVALPSQTDRAVWVGHQFWSRDYGLRSAASDALFAGALDPARAQLLVRLSQARVVLADCGTRADLSAPLRGILASVHRFGCATVYVVGGGAAG